MTNLDEHELLECIMMKLHDEGRNETADKISDILSDMWYEKLTSEDKEYINTRGNFSIDEVRKNHFNEVLSRIYK